MSRPRKGLQALRLAAKAIGEVRYFDTTPCLRGHIAERFTSNSACTACIREKRGGIFTGKTVDVTRLNAIKTARHNALRNLTALKNRIDSLSRTYEACYEGLTTVIKELTQEI